MSLRKRKNEIKTTEEVIEEIQELKVSSSKVIKKDEKELSIYYGDDFYKWKMRFGYTHVLEIEISKPPMKAEKFDFLILQNYTKIQNYLLSLKEDLNVLETYKEILILLCFSKEDISKNEEISISYIEEKSKEIQGMILVKRGEIKELAISKGRETFHVFLNGNWVYTEKNIRKISFIEATKTHEVMIASRPENVPQPSMRHVNREISKLRKYLKSKSI